MYICSCDNAVDLIPELYLSAVYTIDGCSYKLNERDYNSL